MTLKDARLAYFKAHVRICAGHDVERWAPRDIVEAFFTLPAPLISLPDWLDAVGYEVESPPAPQSNPAPAAPPADDAEVVANRTALAALAMAKTDDPALDFVKVNL